MADRRSSNAYKNDGYIERDYKTASRTTSRRSREISANEKHKKTLKVKETPKNKAVRKSKLTFKQLAYIIIPFIIGFWIVSRYVAMYETSDNAAALRENYNSLITENQQIQLQIDRAVDLRSLEQIATSRLGMVRPERYQIHYIDMRMQDYAETISYKIPQEEIPVVGVSGVLMQAIERLIK